MPAQEQLEDTSKWANKVDLEINVVETKFIAIGTNEQELLNLNAGNLDRVDDFKYLGFMLATEEKDLLEIRKGQVWADFWKLKKIWPSKQASIQLKSFRPHVSQSSSKEILLVEND